MEKSHEKPWSLMKEKPSRRHPDVSPADWRLVLLRRHVHVRPKATAAGVAGRDAATLASIRNAVASPCQKGHGKTVETKAQNRRKFGF